MAFVFPAVGRAGLVNDERLAAHGGIIVTGCTHASFRANGVRRGIVGTRARTSKFATRTRIKLSIERDGGSATADASKDSVVLGSPDGPYCEIGIPRVVSHLSDYLEDLPTFPNPASGREEVARHFVANDDLVFKQCVVNIRKPRDMTMYVRAGAREEVYFEPDEVRAAIVSCGGLCPGINTVVREIVGCLQKEYGVEKVFGIPNGYRGFYNGSWIELNEEKTRGIHKLGGSMLGSSRGGHDTQKIVDALEVRGINMVFIIGGDGTIRGADKIQQEARKRRLKMSVVSIPKTIDNDIPVIDHSFGFNSAVEEAQRAIDAANVEACSFPNGLAIVKLMGRNSGFIAMESTLSSRDVDVCLIPEESFTLFGEVGLYSFVKSRLKSKGHCVIVVAEGAGQDILACLGESEGFDKSGNRTLNDIGLHMANEFKNAFKEDGIEVNLKYIDPTYMVRAIRANAYDNLYCTMLSHMAVHGAFAGFTAFTVGPVNGYNVYIPMEDVVNVRNVVNINDRLWLRLVSTTGQPRFTPLDGLCEVL